MAFEIAFRILHKLFISNKTTETKVEAPANDIFIFNELFALYDENSSLLIAKCLYQKGF